MNYLKQILYELKNQKMMTWVSISGTALATFMIMAIYMSSKLNQLEISPVSKRTSILSGQSIDYYHEMGSGSAMAINFELANKLYGNLDGIEKYSFINPLWGKIEVGPHNGDMISAQGLKVDDEYWKIYDYSFVSGTPFNKDEVEAGTKTAVLTKSTAKRIFNEEDVAGREIDVDNIPYIIKGVVEDSYPLLPDGNIQIFLNFSPEDKQDKDNIFGHTNLRMLMKEGINADYIKKQVEKRYEDLNRELKKSGTRVVYHEQPYTSEELIESFGSNNSPKLKNRNRIKALVYIILLLLPAINLSSMTRSRLNSRISEIGVRRAFGAKKINIISQIFMENFLMSLAGGMLGLFLSILFLFFFSDYIIPNPDPETFGRGSEIRIAPVLWNVFNWATFFIAIGACFVLNILSATIPAWRASLTQPALAIAKSR